MRAVAITLAALVLSASGQQHECDRPCVAGDTRTCMYEFNIVEYHTLSRACYDCPNTLSDCEREECVPADGVSRPLLSVNRQLPGPAIQVCEGDRVVVDVHNSQFSDTETIHWHGQHMRSHQYYDGVPFVTQCPIMGSFRYDFPAATPGTHWWHSHTGLHRAEGIFGAFVVRQPEDTLHAAYEIDSAQHVLVMHDWMHTSAMDKFLGRHHSVLDDYARAILVNGKGRNSAAKFEGVEAVKTPLEVVRVTPGLRHRVRLVSATSLNCPIVVSVDGHRLTVIATDGSEVIPHAADSLVIYSGERFDVVLEADQPVDNYWIRFNGLIDCEPFESVQGAVLRYEGAPEEDPKAALEYNPAYPPGIVVNPLNSVDGENEVTMADLDALTPTTLPPDVDRQFYLGFDFSRVNNSLLYNPDLYPYNGVSEVWQVNTPQVNKLNFVFPSAPPLSQPDDVIPKLCRYGEEVSSYCESDFCSCTYLLEAALGEAVEMVLVAEGQIGDENHPFHLHGNKFRVVAMGRLGSATTVQEVMELDAAGGIPRKLQDAVEKDTVTIPDGGFTVVRFTADNPGWWLMHCHLTFHSEVGMAALLHVGGAEDLPPVPTGFPTCGHFMPEI
ncbi:laccase-like [Penaeus japonicus]|uniref:laccase-like n=1 Tax=Penaeus japonicus TaxID=27405 RepID=UPI001C70D1EA|nr:laccase-like [Penaeus japonicus]